MNNLKKFCEMYQDLRNAQEAVIKEKNRRKNPYLPPSNKIVELEIKTEALDNLVKEWIENDEKQGVTDKINDYEWIVFDSKHLPKNGIEVIGFSPEWVCEDFNPNGTRIGFLNGEDGFTSAKWVDYQDCYVEDENTLPTYWMAMPSKDKVLLLSSIANPNQLPIFHK